MPTLRIPLACLSLALATHGLIAAEPAHPNTDLSTASNLLGVPLEDGPEYQTLAKQAPATPRDFGFVYAAPYAVSDEYPHDRAEFERMLKLFKGAGFNVVYCPYTDWRHDLFKKHGLRMMVDVLIWKGPVQTDIRRDDLQRARVKAICQKVKGSDAIWGYNLWNERLDWCGDFKKLDLQLRMLRTWDPTHPVWIGTYRYLYCEHYPTPTGVMAWYDYHWDRGFDWNLHQLRFYQGVTQKRGATMGKWIGIKNYNTNLYTLHTSIAHGVKTVCWFIGGPYAPREKDPKKNWSDDHHLCRIGRRLQPLYPLIGAMGPATAVYATPTRRSADNKTKKQPGLTPHTTAFPEDHWLRIRRGELICGFFEVQRDADPNAAVPYAGGDEIVWVCNQNAWAWQGVTLDLQPRGEARRVYEIWDWDQRQWRDLGAVETLDFPIPPGDAAVLRVRKPAADAQPKDSNRKPEVGDWSPRAEIERIAKLLESRNEVAEEAELRVVAGDRDRPLPQPAPFSLEQGDVHLGLIPLKSGGQAVICANPSPEAWQGVVLDIRQEAGTQWVVSELVDAEQKWQELGPWEDANFPLAPASATTLRLVPRR